MLTANNIAYPVTLDECVTLTPFAAEMRYDYLPPEQTAEDALDRPAALRLVRTALEWAQDIITADS